MANELRPYQKKAVNAARRSLRTHQGTLVVLPTGAGKTRIIAALAKHWHAKHKTRVLVVAPSRELVHNAQATLQEHTGLDTDVEMAEQRANGAPIVVGTVQSLRPRLTKFSPDVFGLVIFDEADLAAAPSFKAIADHFPKAKRFGCTATPDRHDGKELTDLFTDTCHVSDLREFITEGILARVLRAAVEVTSVERAKIEGGDFDAAWLSEVFSKQEHLHSVVKPMLEQAEQRPTLVFAVDVRHARLLAELFNVYRPGCARAIWGSDPNREETLAAFRRGEFQFLVNCMLLGRGVDVPQVACIGMARPTMSHTLYMQMIGRGTRLSPGKADCLVLDFVMNSHAHQLTAFDVVAGKTQAGQEAACLAAKRGDLDVVKGLGKADEDLEASPELRARIQAVVQYQMSWIGDPEQKKQAIRKYFEKHGKFPCKKDTLSSCLHNYCSKSSRMYDPDFDCWARSNGFGFRPVSTNKQAIREYFEKHGRFPQRKENMPSIKTYCSKSSRVYDPDFDCWARSNGYAASTSDANKKAIRAHFKKHGKFPSEKGTLLNCLRNYCHASKVTYDPEFDAWARANGYGQRKKKTP